MHRARIILAAARNNVPAVYQLSYFARDGGLLSYGRYTPFVATLVEAQAAARAAFPRRPGRMLRRSVPPVKL